MAGHLILPREIYLTIYNVYNLLYPPHDRYHLYTRKTTRNTGGMLDARFTLLM